jgi:hypothetical protein
MEEPRGSCPDACGIPDLSCDNYCRECGMYLADVREQQSITVTSTTTALEPIRPALPVPVRRAATAIAVGAAVQVGLTLAARYLASQAARKAVESATRPAATPARRARPDVERRKLPDDVAAVSETLIVRRVWIRRP